MTLQSLHHSFPAIYPTTIPLVPIDLDTLLGRTRPCPDDPSGPTSHILRLPDPFVHFHYSFVLIYCLFDPVLSSLPFPLTSDTFHWPWTLFQQSFGTYLTLLTPPGQIPSQFGLLAHLYIPTLILHVLDTFPSGSPRIGPTWDPFLRTLRD